MLTMLGSMSAKREPASWRIQPIFSSMVSARSPDGSGTRLPVPSAAVRIPMMSASVAELAEPVANDIRHQVRFQGVGSTRT